jgi:hypothetical protein
MAVMRRLLLLSLIVVAGCQNVVGPREHSAAPVRVDHPCLTIDEQKQLTRDRLALPESSRAFVPRDYSDFAGPYGP